MLSQIEAAINMITLSPARQERLIFLGDPAIERQFYSYMAAIGMCYYQGHAPIITTSARKTNRLIVKFARKLPGTEAFHAASLAMKRDGGGLIGKIKAGIRNSLPGFLSGRHRIHIVVAGNRETVQASRAQLATFLVELERAGHFNLDKGRRRNGNSIVGQKKALHLSSTGTLYDLIWHVRHKPGRTMSVAVTGAEQAYRSADLQDDATNFGVGVSPSINPATGLPMVGGTQQDLVGNTFGFSERNYGALNSWPDVNPASGLPMVENTAHDVGGNTYGSNDDAWR